MNSVLVGMFDSKADATSAQSQLVAAGFPASAMSLTEGGTSSSAGIGGTTASSTSGTSHESGGAIARFFDNLFGSDDHDDAERAAHTSTYSEAFKRGSFGLTVTTRDEAEMERAEDILNAAGAIDVDERSEQWRQQGWTGGAAKQGVEGTQVAAGATRKLQEVEEELKVGKRAVSRGGVRVFTRMTETPVEESVTLREEHADIKRTAVDRPASAADLDTFKEGSIEVREMAEEAVVSKTARVTGEVEVGKTATERQETVRDSVRKTNVEVEQIGAERMPQGATKTDRA